MCWGIRGGVVNCKAHWVNSVIISPNDTRNGTVWGTVNVKLEGHDLQSDYELGYYSTTTTRSFPSGNQPPSHQVTRRTYIGPRTTAWDSVFLDDSSTHTRPKWVRRIIPPAEDHFPWTFALAAELPSSGTYTKGNYHSSVSYRVQVRHRAPATHPLPCR